MTELDPVHPGDVLLEELLEPLGVTQHRLAVEMGHRRGRSTRLSTASGGSAPTPALRLARFFGTTDRFWLNLQTRYDLEAEKDHLGTALGAIRPLKSA